jgi:prepilin-type N-terminal cleavage/methylation domain-containing protein
VRGRRRGFTFVELLVSMTIVGILATVAVPKYIDLKRRANTTKVIGDVETVRVAVMSFFADSAYFPEEAGPGAMPKNLQKYLPIGFQFTRPQWTLDYENWDVGAQSFSIGNQLIGVSVTTQDPELGEATSRMLGNAPQFSAGNSVTFLISGI